MSVLAVIEIERQQDGKLPHNLLRLAYRASRRGQIVLVLNDVSPFDVNRAIDALVARMPLNVPGLLYVDGRDAGRLADCSAKANMIFVSPRTEMFWRSSFMYRARNIRPQATARDVLHRIAQPARLSEVRAARR